MKPKTFPRRDAAAPVSLCLNAVAAACAMALAAGSAQAQQAQAAAAPASAASASAAGGAGSVVVVTGFRHSIESSIATKRESNSIVEVVSAEDIGKLPDSSIAESLARLPGLTGQRGADGRVNVISIRGLSPAFSGVLLNGREMVSSNDGRAVEYDQFPSELISSAVVYKTPNAALIGQGLSGTVDMMTRRPLDTRVREVALNARLEANSNGTQVPGVASPIGKRVSASYVNQFADNTIGLAVGFAHLESTTQLKLEELDQYGDYSVYGLPVNGIPNSLFQAPSVSWGPTSKAMLPMFWTGSQSTKKNTRDGLMAVLEYKPNKDLHSQLDLYYSKFDTHEVGGKLTVNQFAQWGGAAANLTNVGTTQIGQNTFATSATDSALPTTTTNYDTRRRDRISALGWNTSLKFADKWTAVSDLSYSRDVRDEKYQEVYAGPWSIANNNWTYGPFSWNVPVDGGPQSFTPLQPGFLSDANAIKFGDEAGFNYVPGEPRWTGVIRNPHVTDTIKTFRLSLKRSLDQGIFSAVTGGLNYTQRDKTVSSNETRLLMPVDANGNNIRDIPAGAVLSPLNMSWMGVPQFIRLDVPYLVASGTLSLKPAELELKANDSGVHEKVTTAYAMLDIDTALANVPIRGNIGVQAIHTQQNSTGWEYRGNNDNVDFSLLYARNGGTSYNDLLPSMNLVAEWRPDLITRFGWGIATARPAINDMRAGTSTPTVDTKPGPNQGYWSTAYAGNPNLKPWKAVALDLSIEKYFGKRSYVSVAAFNKRLTSYITYGDSARDNSAIPLPPQAAGITVQQYGPVFQPLNGHGGRVEGFEFAVSLEGALLTPALDGFGVVFSATKLNSSIRDQKVDQNSNQVIAGSSTSINGLSGISNNLTFYYENYGFSARISQRYRSAFTATTRDIFFRPTTRSQGADKVVDMQLGYAFDDASPLKGVSLMLQVNNLTNTYTRNYKTPGNLDVPDPTQLIPNYTYEFGRQTLAGVNYKF
ncbi:MAG: TonB-dependent receptor [Burkholderiales bacterium]|nr:TonB-dependent receptor [Burkholderiales bacterium]MDE2274742.1 TonB-dependent receptor [Burkholderiales bacterium]